MPGLGRWRRLAIVTVTVATGGVLLAQPAPPEAPPDEPLPAGPLEPPREVVAPADAIPDPPDVVPDRFAVMAFENHTSFDSLDYLIAGAPFALAEKIEDVIGLAPAYGPLIVPGPPVVPGMADTVGPFGEKVGAKWVLTGWYERPNWELRLVVTLWKVEGGKAKQIKDAQRIGKFEDLHQFLGEIVVELAAAAKWTVPPDSEAKLAYRPGATTDGYAFSLFGRGLGHLVGVIGAGVDDKAAAHDLERATFIDPKMVEAQRIVGEMLLTSPEPRAAGRAAGKFSYAIDLRPDYAPALAAGAEAARVAGKADIALDLYRRLLQRRPWDLDARYRLGEALWKIGDSKRAVIELDRVAARRPDDLATRRVLALIHAERGETEKLITELEQIAARAPDDVEVKLDLAGAYAAVGRWDPALTAYQEVATARPLDVTLAKRIGDVERMKGDITAADDWYKRARELGPDDPRAYFAAAQSYLDRGMLDQAHAVLMDAVRFKEYLGPTYHAIGVVQLLRKQPHDGIWYLRRACRLQPRVVATRIATVIGELTRDDRGLARRQLDLAAPAWPDNADLAYLGGILEADAGDRDAARTALERAVKLDPHHGAALAALSALNAGGTPSLTLVPTLELPFGDARTIVAKLDRFEAIDQQLRELRGTFQDRSLSILGLLGEGPTKVKPKRGTAAPRRGCPIADVVRPWLAARTTLADYDRVGVDLEELYRYLARHDDLGETASLLPDQRARVIAARKAYELDLADVRELRAMWTTAIGRELKGHHCSDALLAAAAADPDRYVVRIPPKEVVATQTRKPREPRHESFFVDNRDCPDPLTVYIDGIEVGAVPGSERTVLTADAGQRALCLIVKGSGTRCGDRGTVRQVYMHEGWEVKMRCPR